MIRDLTYTGEGHIPMPLSGPALRYARLPKGAVDAIAVHHMTGVGPPATATADYEIRFLKNIDFYHRTTRGLDGIGYHIVPMASGRIYIVSRLDRYGAGVGGENNHLLHLALPGDYTNELPSPQHLRAAAEATDYLLDYLGRDVPTVPHLYWGGTTCPGARWREWVPDLIEPTSREEEDDMKLLFYRYTKTGAVYAIRPDGKARVIKPGEWSAHRAAGATAVPVDKDPSKIAKA